MPTPSVLLLDIEGTTTSISFVYEVLFPFAAVRIPAFLHQRQSEPAVAAAIAQIDADALPAELTLPSPERAISIVERQMRGDVKATGLKSLQGLVWREGYESGAVRGHVYGDVAPALRRWSQDGRRAAIYSSGSVLAQQLLFRHSEAGDLSPLLSGFFDTTSGPKREAASYARIAAQLGVEPQDVLFGTDQPGEAEAARAAGCRAVVLMRPGNASLPSHLPFAVHGDLRAL